MEDQNSSIRVLDRAFAILMYMADEKRPVGVTEIAGATDLPKATVYRILSSLENIRAVITRGREYAVGPTMLLFADAYRVRTVISEVAHPFLLGLRNDTKETVHLFVFESGELFYLDKLESPYQVRMHSRVGVRGSLTNLSAGKAILATLSPDDRKGLSEAIPAELFSEIREIRKRGYAVDDEQNEAGLRCVGAAVTDELGRPVGAVSISAPVYRFPSSMVPERGEMVRKTACAISDGLRAFQQTPMPVPIRAQR